jgi:chromate transporter
MQPSSTQLPSLSTIFLRFLTIGAISFGGGIVAYLQQMLVEQTGWLTADEFMAALEISQTLPGLNATNMSVLVGDRLRGTWGAVVALLGILLPGGLMVFLLGMAYAAAHDLTSANAVLKGIGAGAVGLLAAITLRIGKRQFTCGVDLPILLSTFVCMSLLKWPLVLVLAVLSPVAIWINRPRKSQDA